MTSICLILPKDKHSDTVCCGVMLCCWAGEKHTARTTLYQGERKSKEQTQTGPVRNNGNKACVLAADEPLSRLHTRPWPEQVLRTIIQRESSGSAVLIVQIMVWEDQQNTRKSHLISFCTHEPGTTKLWQLLLS